MLLPIRTNVWPKRTPYANYVFIILNVIAFLITYNPHRVILGGQIVDIPVRNWAYKFMLTPAWRVWWQVFTYAFLHADGWHILFNMFFLYLFGKNVNDKFGHLGYVAFYLAGATLSGLGHMLVHYNSTTPTLGASGAVAAVTGAYLVLFPQTLITVVYVLFFIGAIEVPALYFIGIKMILLDNIILARTPNVAYEAHLAGYATGIAISLILLATRIVSSSSFDLWAMIKRWNRRRRYRDVVAGGYDPYTGMQTPKTIRAKEVKKTPAQLERDSQINRIRDEIASRIAQRNLAAAADLYIELTKLDPDQILPRQHLLDIANQLASDSRPGDAAAAYEQFLKHYDSYEHADQVRLMLGILYARYLHQKDKAVTHLRAAAEKLSDPSQIEMCNNELARLSE